MLFRSYKHLANHYAEFKKPAPGLKRGENMEEYEKEKEKLESSIKEMEQEIAQLKEKLKTYEDAEKQVLVEKFISAEKRLSGAAVDEEKRRSEEHTSELQSH